MVQDKTERPPGEGQRRTFISPQRKEKTRQRSVKVLMLFMKKTWDIKTFTTATEACVSHVAAGADFPLCQHI